MPHFDTMGLQTSNDVVQQVAAASTTGEILQSMMKALHMAAVNLTTTRKSTLSPSASLAGHQKVGKADSDGNADQADSQQPGLSGN